MARIIKWCDSHKIDCLYFLANADDVETVKVAEDNHFRFVDIRVTLERQLDHIRVSKYRSRYVIRPSSPNDIPTLRDIAKDNYHDSRFYYDINFPEALCNTLYEVWIEKSCNEYAEVVLVADLNGQPVGYISCHLLKQNQGQIGLVGVHSKAQGKGLGQILVNESLRWFAERGIRLVMVVTQGRNCSAQRLYQRCGFLTQMVQLWYHRWFFKKEGKSL